MQTTELVTQTELTRQERIKLWLWKTNRSQAEIARKIGVSKATIGAWIQAESLSIWRVQLLRSAGIPEELLPCVKGAPCGPGTAQPAAQ